MDLLNGGATLVDPTRENPIRKLKLSEVNTPLVPSNWGDSQALRAIGGAV